MSRIDKELIKHVVELQDSMNSMVHSDWRSQNYPYYRALWIECGELADHLGYKFWKANKVNKLQVQLELVDILHFGISMLLQQFDNDRVCLILESSSDDPSLDLKENKFNLIELLVTDAILHKHFNYHVFIKLCQLEGMSIEDVFKLYILKNALNRVRQDFGYKTGEYQKLWYSPEDGTYKEDNEYIFNLIQKNITSVTEAYKELCELYNKYATHKAK